MAVAKAESIEEMTESFLGCRDKGHHWEFVNDKVTHAVRGKVREVTRWFQCKGCTTEMYEVFEIPSCDVLARHYAYPDGYLVAAGVVEGRRLNVRDVRREVFARHGIKF